MYVFLGEVSVQALCPFFNWIVCLVLSVISSLYLLDINSLSELFTNIFSHSVSCAFVSLAVSLVVQKIFSLL